MTYTADQMIAIGGRRWQGHGGVTRVYLNDWADLIGRKISNTKATTLTSAKVYWEAGRIHTDLFAAAAGARLDADTLTARLYRGIDNAVAAAQTTRSA